MIEKLEPPLNFTDPYVLHDPAAVPGSIADEYMPDHLNNPEMEERSNNRQESTIKTKGILAPLVMVNTKLLHEGQVESMIIYYRDFVPSIELVIHDDDQLIKNTDIPNLNNVIRVIIIPEIENVYKSISLDFNILSVNIDGNTIKYSGKYKHLPFNKKRIKELIYPGCPNVVGKSGANKEQANGTAHCNPPEQKRPNTWELLHIIAQECELGFCSTDHCQEIEDRLPRLVYNKSYDDFLEEQLEFSGLDEDSIFDAWIDLYGYIVMVNFAWIITNQEVIQNNLAIKVFPGIHGTQELNMPEQKPKEVHRTLVCMPRDGSINNLSFTKYNVIINNSDLVTGTNRSMYNCNLIDIAGNISITQYDVESIENSVDGKHTEEYAKEQQKSLAIECNDIPINKQKMIRQKYFNKYRARILEIEMDKVNLGLQRGTLVNVVIMTDEANAKQLIAAASTNLIDNQDVEPDKLKVGDLEYKDLIEQENIALPNMALTGMYYIDSMKFEYSYDNNEIKQFLYLIKKGSITNLNNWHTNPRIEKVDKFHPPMYSD